MKKIAIITFHFIKTPWYMDFFVNSCFQNKDVDFLFFTDIVEIERKYKGENLRIILTTFEDFKKSIYNHFDFDFNIISPLKLCDIRPSFGEVFKNYLSNYDFWGYCDTDIVFGRIRDYLTDEVLDEYDVIFAKEHYPSGFFAMYRNLEVINELYRTTDYKKTFQNEKLLLFDECGGHYDEVCAGTNILDTNYDVDSIHHILERNKDKVKVLYDFSSIESIIGEIRYEEGVLSFENKIEFLLYHFTIFKKTFFFKEKDVPNFKTYNSYYIGKYKISKSNWLNIKYNNLRSYLTTRISLFTLKLKYYYTIFFGLKKMSKLEVGLYTYMKQNRIINCHSNKIFMVYPDGRSNEIVFVKNDIFYEINNNKFYKSFNMKNSCFNSFSAININGGVYAYSIAN